jgi:FkbM family methyltransferase
MITIAKIQELQKRILRKIGYQRVVPNGITRDNFFEMYFALKRPFVVQIGTNDGKTHDSLYRYITKYQLPGLLVEPQPDIFQVLKENYKENKNLQFANVAVGDKNGEIPFYRIKPELVIPGMEYKASSGSSFYREQIVGNVKNRLPPLGNNILKSVSNNPDDYIQEISIKVNTLDLLLHEYGVTKIDFLLIDCQGFDYKILKQIDFEKFSPDIINFEHGLLCPEELQESQKILKNHGFGYFIHEADTCAYKI